ncbi:AraC family transcriptional regulator [Enterobacter hormaechei]|uniref:AraC family transcriptional regulator n=1 Tax=Enterobacter hormaechei TaxID=158836 RepID=UPI0009B52F48|nr:AraC family transcriptional regulator [Enterobacter hormaechei]
MSHNVVILAVPGVQMLDVCGPIDVFAEANRVLRRDFYTLRILSVTGPVVQSSSGVKLSANASLTDCTELITDTFIIAGAPEIARYQPDSRVLEKIDALCESSRRYGSVCTGALLLALTGRLSGKRVTTHWACADVLSVRHPEITVEAGALYVADGRIRTAAGVTSGLDMALRLVAAIRLYESFSFELAEEWEGDQWGTVITEQLYIRKIRYTKIFALDVAASQQLRFTLDTSDALELLRGTK